MGSSSRWLKTFQYRLYSALGRTWYFFLEHLGSQQGGCQQKESYGYTSAECRDFWSHIELQTHLLFLQLTWLPSFPGWAKCVEWVGAVWGQVALWLNWAPSPPTPYSEWSEQVGAYAQSVLHAWLYVYHTSVQQVKMSDVLRGHLSKAVF